MKTEAKALYLFEHTKATPAPAALPTKYAEMAAKNPANTPQAISAFFGSN